GYIKFWMDAATPKNAYQNNVEMKECWQELSRKSI
ncbi:hypothetical protein A3Q56_08657, partial [Intoshia linei]